MTEQEYEEEKKFVLSELADKDTQKRGLGADYITDLIKPFNDDKEVMLACLKHHSGSTELASKRLWADKEFVTEVVQRNGNCLSFASDRLKEDVDVVKAACGETVYAFQYSSSKIKSDPELIAKCSNIIDDPVLRWIDSSVMESKEKILSLIENGYSHQHNMSGYDKETVANIVMSYASEEIQSIVGNGNPVEVLTKAVASEKLAAKLSNQLRPRIEPRQQSMKI